MVATSARKKARKLKESNIWEERSIAASKFNCGQKVWKKDKDRYYFGKIYEIEKEGFANVFVVWEGKEIPVPECPTLLNDGEKFDSEAELKIYYYLANDDTAIDAVSLSDFLEMDVYFVDSLLESLKKKQLVVSGSGLWKRRLASTNLTVSQLCASVEDEDATAEFDSAVSVVRESSAVLSLYGETSAEPIDDRRIDLEKLLKNHRMSARAAVSDKSAIEYLCLDEITGSIQGREKFNLTHANLLAEQLCNDNDLAPVVVYYDREKNERWIADGIHRERAYRSKNREVIPAVVFEGDKRMATLYALGANEEHQSALKRTNADKRNVVRLLLSDTEWRNWSDRYIAEICRVHHNTVSAVRKDLACGDLSTCQTDKKKSSRHCERNGETIVMGEKIVFGCRVSYGGALAAVLETERRHCSIQFEMDGKKERVKRTELAVCDVEYGSWQRGDIVSVGEEELVYFYPLSSTSSFVFDPSTKEIRSVSNCQIDPLLGATHAEATLARLHPQSSSQIVEVDLDEILMAVISNLEKFQSDRLELLLREIAARSPEGIEAIAAQYKQNLAEKLPALYEN